MVTKSRNFMEEKHVITSMTLSPLQNLETTHEMFALLEGRNLRPINEEGTRRSKEKEKGRTRGFWVQAPCTPSPRFLPATPGSVHLRPTASG
jgi:hypothetical protein